jgi:uncharacterized membrane-anchored protein YjiN (DUF445 family)
LLKEDQQESQLKQARRLATGLLILMTCVFIGSRLFQSKTPWLIHVAAFAEAAMVGALADWFAVTALFRAPLGLPIPHTAIIPRNKDRIGASIANFLEHNFLTPAVIAAELNAIDFSGVVANWLSIETNSRRIAMRLIGLLPAVLRIMEDQDVARFLQEQVRTQLGTIRFGPMAADVLTMLMTEQQHQQLFDHLIKLGAAALIQNRPLIRQKIHERSPRWMPKSIDERFFNRLLEELQNFLEEMAQPESQWRLRFSEAVLELVTKLRTSPDFEATIAAYIAEMVQHPAFSAYSAALWRNIKLRLITDARSEQSSGVAWFEKGLQSLGQALSQDQVVRTKLNHWLAQFATDIVIARRTLIADLVRRVIQTWDAQTVSRKFELYVGRDLQYIRINGTLVGGLVGLLLHFLSLML